MDFVINEEELAAIGGLPHIQQLIYLRGIRPYMDVNTGIVGIKRRVSFQSISEQLYVEPCPGIKSQAFSRDQVKRAIYNLARMGVIELQSENLHLILNCKLATKSYSVQNKAATNPPQKATLKKPHEMPVNTEVLEDDLSKGAIAKVAKAASPLKDNNYIYLLSSQFEVFWELFPEKKSKSQAQIAFQNLHPDELLFKRIMTALQNQIQYRIQAQSLGQWVPPWKYPANWLEKRCWEDEINFEVIQESQHECRKSKASATKDLFWSEELSREFASKSNVIGFKARGSAQEEC